MKRLLFCVLFLASCAPVTSRISLSLDGDYSLTQAHTFMYAAFEGYDNLEHCEYLQRTFPQNYKRLLQMRSHVKVHLMTPTEVAAAEESHKKPICGQAILHKTTIDVNPQADCEWSKTLTHEMIHMIGFKHGKEFDRVLDECYSGGTQ